MVAGRQEILVGVGVFGVKVRDNGGIHCHDPGVEEVHRRAITSSEHKYPGGNYFDVLKSV